ncbi:MAG: hypothetical protein WBX13_09665 [Candidatus Acidiferrales bacterium]
MVQCHLMLPLKNSESENCVAGLFLDLAVDFGPDRVADNQECGAHQAASH